MGLRNRIQMSEFALVNAITSSTVANAKPRDRVGAAVVDGEPAGVPIAQRRAGESHVGHVADALVEQLRREQIRLGAIDHLPRLVQVQQRGAETVHETVARRQHAVVEEQPTLAGLDRRRAGADLGALPAAGRRHHEPMPAPEAQIRALAVVHVAERRVSAVAGPAEHRVAPVDPPREQDAVAVVGQKRVFELVEGDEIVRVGQADGRAVIAVAPGHVIAVLDPADARVVAVLQLADLGVIRRRSRWCAG